MMMVDWLFSEAWIWIGGGTDCGNDFSDQIFSCFSSFMQFVCKFWLNGDFLLHFQPLPWNEAFLVR